jgi:uncharacterized protein YndB with AHSA1/START domain
VRNFSYSITIAAPRERVWDDMEDTEGEMARKWIGSIEVYELREVDAGTELHVRVTTDEQFEEMFETSWPKALELLKGICEQP